MDALLERNLDAVRRLSEEAAELVRAAPVRPDASVSRSATGLPVLDLGGRPLDSRRDPVRAAAGQADAAPAARVVLIGLGTGYLLDELLARGVEVAALVEHDPGVVRAALGCRDLTASLARTPLVLLDQLRDPVALARLRRRADHVVAHGASVASSQALSALAGEWERMKVASRRPRVLVAGPIYGGSLEVARSVADACRSLGAETLLADAAIFGAAHARMREGGLPEPSRAHLLGRLTEVASDYVLHTAQPWRPDLLIALAQAPLTEATLRAFREAGVTTAFWFVENHRVLTYWRQVAGLYDRFYAIQPGAFLERLHEAGAAHPRYLPMACAPARHRAVPLTAEERARWGADVSFAGARYHNRGRLFASLMDFDLKLWGPDWGSPEFGGRAGDGGRAFDLEEMIRIFAATRINLNVHSANHVTGLDPEPDYVNPRTFELASCGAFQLVDWRSPLGELFAADEMVTFRSVGELRSLIAAYLPREDERRTMADRARARAHAEHTYERRVETILRDTLPPALVASALDGDREETLDEAAGRLAAESPTLTEEEALVRMIRAMIA